MKKNGFTLTELLAVIVLLGIVAGICITSVLSVSNNVKKKTLETKIENIEKAAVLYGQNNSENFTASCSGTGEPCSGITGDCFCYGKFNNETMSYEILPITLRNLLDPDGDGNYDDAYVSPDEGTFNEIKNPLNELDMLDCELQIYKKYGRVYAVYDKETDETKTQCYYD